MKPIQFLLFIFFLSSSGLLAQKDTIVPGHWIKAYYNKSGRIGFSHYSYKGTIIESGRTVYSIVTLGIHEFIGFDPFPAIRLGVSYRIPKITN